MLALIQAAQREAEPLSAGGWLMMILSVIAMTTLVVYCYKRILTPPEMDEPDLPGGLGP